MVRAVYLGLGDTAGVLPLDKLRDVLSVLEPLLWLLHFVKQASHTERDVQEVERHARAVAENYVRVFGEDKALERPKLHKLSELARQIRSWGPPAHFHDGIFELCFKLYVKDEFQRTTHSKSSAGELLLRHAMRLFCNVELSRLLGTKPYNATGLRRELVSGETARQVIGVGRNLDASELPAEICATLRAAWKRFRSSSDEAFKSAFVTAPAFTVYDAAWVTVEAEFMDGTITARPSRAPVGAPSGIAGKGQQAREKFDFVQMASAAAVDGAPRLLAQLQAIFTVTSNAGVVTPFVAVRYLGNPIFPQQGDQSVLRLQFAERRAFPQPGAGIFPTYVESLASVLRSWPVYPRFVGAAQQGWFALPVV